MATNAIRFDNIADILNRTTNVLDYNSPYTCMFWVYISANTGSYGHFWSTTILTPQPNDYTNSDFTGHDNSNPRLHRAGAVITPPGAGGYPLGTALSLTTYYHITARRSSATLFEVFLDAAPTADLTDTTDITGRTASANETIGNLNSLYNLDGRIGCMKQWTTALTTTEIAAEKPYSNAIKTANLHEVWNFVPGPSRLVGDINGYTWTESGTTTDEAGPPVTEFAGNLVLTRTTFPKVSNKFKRMRVEAGGKMSFKSDLTNQ